MTSVLVSSQLRMKFWDVKIRSVQIQIKYNIMTTQHFLQKSELPILDFRKTLLLYVANTGNSDPFLTSRINVETGLKPGPLSLQHLLGPRHCRYFRPVTDRRVTTTDQHCSVNKLAPKNDL